MPDQGETRLHLARTAAQRSGLYRLLAAIFRQEPDSEMIEWLRSERFENLLSQAGFELGDEFGAKAPEIVKEELAVEFTRLFLGPGKHISPHESVQLPNGSGTLWGKESVLVKRFIEAAGFDYERDFNGIPDHISVELDFLALLTEAEADNWKAGDTGSGVNVLDWQNDFISRHAAKWMPGFCDKVKAGAELPFYPVFAGLLQGFLADEQAEIPNRLKQARSEATNDTATKEDVRA